MKILSTARLAKLVIELRKKKGLTQEQLGEQTSLNRVMVGRIERENFIPSVVQLQALSSVLGFDLTEIFVEQEKEPSFIALRSENLSEEDRKDFDRLLSMMLALRQQLTLRKAYEHESYT
ncbi:MAG: helix-turn-helix domain-containing protein [Proteobacteria bacterium]|nr:helix-turn-helix domain-containing protein [Pseudomonadota bacterium]